MQKDFPVVQYFCLLQNPLIDWLIRISFQGGCQQIEDLPAVFCGGLEGLPAMFVEDWPADHLMTASFAGGGIHDLIHGPHSLSCFRT